jgi:hypothetical protein
VFANCQKRARIRRALKGVSVIQESGARSSSQAGAPTHWAAKALKFGTANGVRNARTCVIFNALGATARAPIRTDPEQCMTHTKLYAL